MDSEHEQDEQINFPQQDKIELKTNTKGLITASVRIGGKMDSNESIDGIITRQKYAWARLRENFRNLIWAEGEEKKEVKNEKLDDDND